MAKEETKQFESAFSLLKPSARALMLNGWTFLSLFTFVIILSIISSMTEGRLDSPVMMIFYILSLLASIALAPAFIVAELRSAKGEEIAIDEVIKEGFPYVIRLFFLQILSLLIIIVGLILLIVPGVFAFQRLLLAPLFLVDKDLGVIDALKASYEDAKTYSGAVWGLIGVTLAYMLLFLTIILIPASIALLIAYICAPAIRYYQIQSVKKKS